MRGPGVLLAGLALAVSACAASASAPASPGSTVASPGIPSTFPAPVGIASPAHPSPAASPTFCPGRTWPPYPLGGVPGITAVSTSRVEIVITNHTGRTYSYRISGWQPDQFESCRALGEMEVQRGPIAPGTAERVRVDAGWWQSGVPVTVAFWDRPCGEACQREPIAAMRVELSPLEPAAS